MIAPLPLDEPERLAALRRLGLLDTPPDPWLDEIVRVAAKLCGTPMAAVSLVDQDRQWFKARVGFDLAETRREWAFCAHAILASQPMVVSDATADDRFSSNPMVLADGGIRFYAASPLVTREGHALGTLCVIDSKPRTLVTEQLAGLVALSRAVMAYIEQSSLRPSSTRRDKAVRPRPGGSTHSAPIRILRQDLPVGVIIRWPAAGTEFLNREAHRLLDPSASPALRQGVLGPGCDLVRSDGTPFWESDLPMVKVARSGAAVHGVIAGLKPPGASDRIWLVLSAEPVMSPSGEEGVLCLLADLTSLRRGQRRQAKRVRRLRAMLDGAADAIALHDPSGRFIDVNARACETLGFTRDELLRLSVADVDVDWPTERVVDAVRNLLPGQVMAGGGTHRRRDGTTFPVEVRVSAVSIGKKRLLAAVARDATEQRRAETALQASERRYRTLFENTPAFTCTHDLEGVLLTINPSAARGLGFEPADLEGRPLHAMVAPRFRGQLREYLAALVTRHVASGTLAVVTRTGEERVWRYRSAVQQPGEGSQAYVIGSAEDVTELVRIAGENRQMALTDSLTGIPNRRAGAEALAREISRADRQRSPLAVILFDVDRFKSLNDAYGHAAGDRVLKDVAGLLQGSVRLSDQLVRWGGEEFLAVLPGEGIAAARAVAERARETLQRSELGTRFGATLSAGVSELRPGDEAADLLRRADEALYRAKAEGRNRVR